jgi:hypothetical protein
MSESKKIEDEGRWGGKRSNQTGRPKMPEEFKRTQLTTTISQETKHWLLSQKEGVGRTIDMMVVKAKLKK